MINSIAIETSNKKSDISTKTESTLNTSKFLITAAAVSSSTDIWVEICHALATDCQKKFEFARGSKNIHLNLAFQQDKIHAHDNCSKDGGII